MEIEICISRVFDLVDSNSKFIKKIELRVYKPYQLSVKEWKCDYQLLHLNDDDVYSIIGVDSLQVFLLALQLVDLRLQMYNDKNPDKIYWLDNPLNNFGLINKCYD